jgi:alpha-2-macroglobulin
VRKDFPDAIYWVADLVTDAEGRARVAVKYPDALTTWRLTARAITKDTNAAAAVARTTTTKDLIVRVITPRFLTEGDEVVVPTIVHNYRDEARQASVESVARGLDVVGDATSLTTEGALASGAERRDDWRYAARVPGTAFVTAAARTETDTDAVELPIPVLPYGLRRDVGQGGSMSGAGEQTAELSVPSTANTAGRMITVSLAPSLAGSMLGALDFLTSYPYGCTEQTLSSLLPNVLVTRTLTQLKLAPTERLSALDRQVSEGLRRLSDYQHDDGGWGWWKTDANHPFMTAYALFGLIEARGAGYKVDEWRIASGARALGAMYAEYPRAEPDLKAYIAYVLARAADPAQPLTWYREGEQQQYRHDVARDDLWAARQRMSAYGRALLLMTPDAVKDGRGDELADALSRDAQTRGELAWWSSTRDPLLFDSVDTRVEATSLAVQALARRDPRNPLLERAVRWLLLNRSGGHWGTTKQTAMAIYGLLELLQARNETPQAVTVEIYINDALAGTRTLGESALTAPDPIVVTAPAHEGANRVRLVTKGAGAVYWAAAASYYDTAAAGARSGSRELAITRRYARLVPVRSGNRIVYREQPLGTTVAPGDVISVRLTVAGSSDWRYLVIEDPLAAGVEAIQDTTAYPLEREPRNYWWWGSRVEYRDSRTVFFQESFDRGRYEFNYLVKVVSAGVFRAVPAQIAPMYVPGVTASSEPQTVAVTTSTGSSP